MGKIFYLMGKSASGKDSIYKRLRSVYPELKSIVLYTTRPMRLANRKAWSIILSMMPGLRSWSSLAG